MNRHMHPEVFQKKFYNRNYFEGWYYKLVSADGRDTISFIPGVSYSKNGSHSFIQCLHGSGKRMASYNIDYPIRDFSHVDAPFSISIDGSSFSLTSIDLNMESNNLSAAGEIQFGRISPIRKSALCPNIMGFFSYIPFMECNHGVISMNHDLTGKIEINGEAIDFTGGKGYIEKDWGRSFPEKYIWVQSNHFENHEASLFCSVATIPFLTLSFTGFICNLQFGEKEYRFATYTAAKLSILEFTESQVSLEFKDKRHTLKVAAKAAVSKELVAPKNGAMKKTIKEVLSGEISVELTDKSGNALFSSSSDRCGMELVQKL